jgi:hypothetical protein
LGGDISLPTDPATEEISDFFRLDEFQSPISNPKSEILNPKSEILNPKSDIRNLISDKP